VFLQIEREKADLSVQVIQLTERLEEAEGGAESQVRLTALITRIEEAEGGAFSYVSNDVMSSGRLG
jgi:hypothetical protein